MTRRNARAFAEALALRRGSGCAVTVADELGRAKRMSGSAGMGAEAKAITLGHPSYVWRYGQQRRLDMVRRYVRLEGARILDAGCGLGVYMSRFEALGGRAFGVDVDPERIVEARQVAFQAGGGDGGLRAERFITASADCLPFADASYDVVFSHEVIEHVGDDAAAVREAWRVLRPGGHLVLFCPNRWYPFETHGCYWRGHYHFGNIPLVNYLPSRWRRRLCPHVRAYRTREVLGLLRGLPGRLIVQRIVFAGYDNVVERRPRFGRLLRRLTYALEGTPLQCFGLSHFIVFQRDG